MVAGELVRSLHTCVTLRNGTGSGSKFIHTPMRSHCGFTARSCFINTTVIIHKFIILQVLEGIKESYCEIFNNEHELFITASGKFRRLFLTTGQLIGNKKANASVT